MVGNIIQEKKNAKDKKEREKEAKRYDTYDFDTKCGIETRNANPNTRILPIESFTFRSSFQVIDTNEVSADEDDKLPYIVAASYRYADSLY